jgi:hypothetical protein
MRLWPQPLKGYRLLRRLLVEARAIRRALERSADAQELMAGNVPRESVRGQSFRSFTHTSPLTDREVQDRTEVSYVDEAVLAQMLEREEELRAILGRDPTEAEIMRAYEGEIE